MIQKDFEELHKYLKTIGSKSALKGFDVAVSDALVKEAKRLLDIVKGRTPVGGTRATHGLPPNDGEKYGDLRDAWDRDNARLSVRKRNGNYTITIRNNTPYASHVEFGWRQRVGRYVSRIQRRLVQPVTGVKGEYWVHFLMFSEEELKEKHDDEIERAILQFLMRVYGT